MTCIVGLVVSGRVWIAGDSFAAAGCQRFTMPDSESKVIKRGELVIGAAGPVRIMQILEHIVEIPEHPADMEPMPYLVKLLMPAIRTAITEHGGVNINDEHNGWEFLLGYRGGLYSVCHDLSVTTLPSYGSVGCGHEFALGALYAIASNSNRWAGQTLAPPERLVVALEAAAAHDVHVAGPFIVEMAA